MRVAFTCLFLFVASFIYGQSIEYQKSYKEALALAAQTNKPLFVTLTPPAFNIKGLPQFPSGLDTKEVAALYNKNFISVKVIFTDSTVNDITGKLHPTIFPCYVFLDSKGGILYTSSGNTNFTVKFEDMASQALSRLASGKTLTNYEQLYKAGSITKQQLKEYITLRESLNIFDNAVLIDKYVDMLTVNDLNNYKEVLFALQAGPYADSKAYKLLRTNEKLFDSLYRTEPLETRVAINNRIINNTRAEAIKTKNASMAQANASFMARSWSNNYQEGSKASTREMLYYYKAVKDTTRYFQQAEYFYDNYYLNITADSARRLQIEALNKARAAAPANQPVTDIMRSAAIQQVSFIQLSPAKSAEVAGTLNNAAYDFYLLGTHNTNHLIKALVWSRRSIQLSPMSGYYDTMAHIMYRLGFYDEALLNQNKAIEMAAKEPGMASRIDSLKGELAKMKSHQL